LYISILKEQYQLLSLNELSIYFNFKLSSLVKEIISVIIELYLSISSFEILLSNANQKYTNMRSKNAPFGNIKN